MTGRYAFPRSRPGEPKRLRLLERYVDPFTRRCLVQAGISTGMTCADLGAGSGSVANWMSRRVGETGQVDAYDLDTSLLPMRDNIEHITADVATCNFRLPYDLVFARFLLVHLPEPVLQLNRMVSATTPEGRVCVVESDYHDWEMPAGLPHMERLKRAYLQVAADFGWDMELGRRLPALFQSLGLHDVAAESFSRCERGGSIGNLLLSQSVEPLENHLLNTGVVSEDDVRSAYQTLRDPDYLMRFVTTWACWGTVPYKPRETSQAR